MKHIIKACYVLLIIAVPGAMIVPSLTRSAGAQSCELVICKSAEGAGDTPFEVRFEVGGEVGKGVLIDQGLCILQTFDSPNTLTVAELPTPGWVLDDVLCPGLNGIEITNTNDGFVAECVSSSAATCTLINVEGTAEVNVPTLGEWGVIATAAGLGLIGVFFALKRLRAGRGSEQA